MVGWIPYAAWLGATRTALILERPDSGPGFSRHSGRFTAFWGWTFRINTLQRLPWSSLWALPIPYAHSLHTALALPTGAALAPGTLGGQQAAGRRRAAGQPTLAAKGRRRRRCHAHGGRCPLSLFFGALLTSHHCGGMSGRLALLSRALLRNRPEVNPIHKTQTDARARIYAWAGAARPDPPCAVVSPHSHPQRKNPRYCTTGGPAVLTSGAQ